MVSEDIKLIQKRFLKGRRVVTLSDKAVVVVAGGKFTRSEQTFPYEFLAEEALKITDASKSWLGWGAFFLGICLFTVTISLLSGDPYLHVLFGTLLWLIFALICGIFFLFSRVKYTVYIAATGDLKLFTDKPSKDDFRVLVKELETRRARFMDRIFCAATSDGNVIDKLYRLSELKNRGDISLAEFDVLKRELLGDTDQGPASRGNILN